MDSVGSAAAGVAVLFQRVGGADDEIIVAAAGKRRVAEGKGITRRDTERRAVGVNALLLGLPLLLADAGVKLTV